VSVTSHMNQPLKILYAFQGTGNGHVARARDLIPRFAAHGAVDVLIAGTESDLDVGVPIRYKLHGLTMVYDKHGAVSYWRSLWKNKLVQFCLDVLRLPVKEYDLVIIDFEAVTSYASKLRSVKALQLSHQAAYLSPEAPRPSKKIWHWEWVLRHMSPAAYAIGFHFQAYGPKVLPPIIRAEIRSLTPLDGGHYTVYLPSYDSRYVARVLRDFPTIKFEIFAKDKASFEEENISVKPANVEGFKESLRTCTGIICGAGFEAPAEAVHLKKKVLVIPIKGQYEQLCNGLAAEKIGLKMIPEFSANFKFEINEFISATTPQYSRWPDYAAELVKEIVKNAEKGLPLDDISSLQVW